MLSAVANSCAALIALAFAIRVYCVYFVWGKCRDGRSLEGKTVIITGANSGIGEQTARQLASRGARVVMACRHQESALNAIRRMCGPTHRMDGQLLFKHLDLTSFDSVKRFVDDILENESSVDVLINNAAVFQCPFNATEDGFEEQLEVNHLSNALLTSLLLPKLMDSCSDPCDPSRVIFVTSTLYKRGNINDNHFLKGYANAINYDKSDAYNSSKLANILYANGLWNNLKEENERRVAIYMASPGIVWTNLNRHVSLRWWQWLLLSPFALAMLRTARQGSQTILHCVTAEALMPATLYRNCRPHSWNKTASDPNLSSKVYQMTMKAIQTHVESR